MDHTKKQTNYLFYIALLLTLTPLIHSKTTIFGTIVQRSLYFWLVIDVALIFTLFRQKITSIKFNYLQLAVLIYFVISLLAAILGTDIYLNLLSNFERMMGVVGMLHFVVFFFLFSNYSFSETQINTLIYLTLIIGTALSFWGIAEVMNGKHYRAESVLSNPMHFALYLVLQIYLGIYCLFRWKNYPSKLVIILYLIVCLIALMLTQTRAAFVALLIGGLIMLIITIIQSHEKLKLIIYTLIVSIVSISIAFVGIKYGQWDRIDIIDRIVNTNFAEDTSLVRLKIWKMCLQHTFDKPFLGWGQGSFVYFYFQNFTSELNNAGFWYDSSHNNFIDQIIGAGYLGLFSYCLIFFISFKTIWMKNNQLLRYEKLLLTGVIVSYLAFIFFGFDSLISYLGIFSLFIIIQKYSPIKWSVDISKVNLPMKFVKIVVSFLSVLSLYFFVYKSFQTNELLSKAHLEQNISEMISLYDKAYKNAIIGEYDVAVDFALKQNSVLASKLSNELNQRYFSSIDEVLKTSLNKHSENPVLLNQKGFAEYQSNRKLAGIKTFELMNKLSPNRLINHHDYAWLLFNNNQVSESIYILDKVIKKQHYNSKAIILKARILFESKQSKEAFKALDIYTPKEVIENFKEITNLIFEYQQYNEFYDFIYAKFSPNHLNDFVLTEEQVLIWSQIAQLSKDKKQIYSVFSYFSGNTLLGDDRHFRQKKDSLMVLELIDKVHQGTVNYDVIMTLKDFN
ncbi:O-antigen ligase family protein [Emticicia sp. SJ17W-69]|uniref:O-antigen ligase family protein n=1 Tax=Emticicia sp. SJ17W-69 TaxID=3421657 RepID=UPI003EBF9A27